MLLDRQAFSGRGSKGPGESMDVTDMLSNSGVPGSRYGLVVLMKVTAWSVRGSSGANSADLHTILWDVHPDGIVFKRVLVSVESLERIFVP